MRIEAARSIEEAWRAVFEELGAPEAILALTFAFSSDFFSRLLDQFQEAAAKNATVGEACLANIPIDVVCDQHQYKGHRKGFNVSFWPDSTRLFHPKLLIVLFESEVVWSGGSLNMTHTGWNRNREVVFFHRPKATNLPRALRELLQRIPQVEAARSIVGKTSNDKRGGFFVTSLDRPIGHRFISGIPGAVEEVHLAAPFFGGSESPAHPSDNGWLHDLASAYHGARFHIYLPRLSDDDGRPKLRGDKRTMESLSAKLDKPPIIHPVSPKPGPLHGKLACLVYPRKQTRYARLLAGSPNMTSAALALGPKDQGNIETAWILKDERWKSARKLLTGLGAGAYSIDEADFSPPEIQTSESWMPLKRVWIEQPERILNLEWKEPDLARETILIYGDRDLVVNQDNTCRLESLGEEMFLITRRRGGNFADGYCPIELPSELLPAFHCGAVERAPEDWLNMLGEAPPSRISYSHARAATRAKDNSKVASESFQWSDRVRHLASRLRRFIEIENEHSTHSGWQWHRQLLDKIFTSFDPGCEGIPGLEQTWRVWVRLELWNAALTLSRRHRLNNERLFWQKQAVRYRKAVCPAGPPSLKKQVGAIMNALEFSK